MTSYFISFATKKYKTFQEYQNDYAREDGFDVTISYTPEVISNFWSANQHILNPELNGGVKNGGCAFKGYILYQTMMQMRNEDDWLLYADCGDVIDLGFKSFVESKLKNSPYFFVQNEHNHRDYTKKEAFEIMKCDYPKFWNAKQLEAGIIGLRRDASLGLVKEFADWCIDPDVVLDYTDHNVIRHSRDQSILTMLQVRENLPVTSIYEVMKYVRYNGRDEGWSN